MVFNNIIYCNVSPSTNIHSIIFGYSMPFETILTNFNVLLSSCFSF